jgi:hypothetical protein
MPIQDLKGAYCPMGCGETLHRMPGGLIECMYPSCPDSGAAWRILHDRETGDIVDFDGGDGWAIIHPLRERLTGMLNCPVHRALAAGGAPEGLCGRYRATVSGPIGVLYEKIGDDGG